jgi:hypothetical protein
MRSFVIRARTAAYRFLMAFCLLGAEACVVEPAGFRHLLTLPVDYDPQAKRSGYMAKAAHRTLPFRRMERFWRPRFTTRGFGCLTSLPAGSEPPSSNRAKPFV